MINWFKSTSGASIGVLLLSTAFIGAMAWLSAPEPTASTSAAQSLDHNVNAPSVFSPDPLAYPNASADQPKGHDPFKARLLVQSANPKLSPISNSATSNTSASPIIPLGVDPFKDKLHEQTQQAKSVAISPFLSTAPTPPPALQR